MNLQEHSYNVSKISFSMGYAMKMTSEELEKLAHAAFMHDIGKLKIPGIINKEGKLNHEETKIMRSHPEFGAKALEQLCLDKNIIEGVLYHHERMDGDGYPSGLYGHKIPLYARIITIADAFDAMVSQRCYKAAMSPIEALKEIVRNIGTQFDPEIAEIFLRVCSTKNKYNYKAI